MNFLFLSELFPPHGGGAEVATNHFAESLKAEGLNTIVVTNRFPGEREITRDGKMSIYRLPLFKESASVKYSVFVRADIEFSQFLRKLMKWADVVYIPRYWFSAIFLARLYRKPSVVHLHDYIPICPMSIRYDLSRRQVCTNKHPYCSSRCIYVLERSSDFNLFRTASSVLLNSTVGRCLSRLVELCDSVICASNAQRNLIVGERPSLLPKIQVIPNLIPEVKQVDMVGKDFAYFGGPNFLKGFHTLFAAAWQLKNRLHSKARIQVSDFSDISAEFSERLRSQEFILHGRLSGSAYDDVYAQIRSVIMPSINPEVLPYVTMEALLRKRLLIASNVGGVPEIVENCPGVFTFPPGDSNQLAKTMEHVWSLSSDVVADLSARNRENFIKRFDNQKTKSDFIQLLKRVQHKYT